MKIRAITAGISAAVIAATAALLLLFWKTTEAALAAGFLFTLALAVAVLALASLDSEIAKADRLARRVHPEPFAVPSDVLSPRSSSRRENGFED